MDDLIVDALLEHGTADATALLSILALDDHDKASAIAEGGEGEGEGYSSPHLSTASISEALSRLRGEGKVDSTSDGSWFLDPAFLERMLEADVAGGGDDLSRASFASCPLAEEVEVEVEGSSHLGELAGDDNDDGESSGTDLGSFASPMSGRDSRGSRDSRSR